MSEFVEPVPEVQRGTAIVLPPPERMRAEVWALAWPVIISYALDSILGLAAMLMVGRLGAEAVGAVGLATQILGAVRAGVAAVGTGTVALVARHIGGGDRDRAEDTLAQSVIFGVLVSTVIAIPVIVFAPQMMALFRVKGLMAEMGVRYLRIVMLAEPFQGIFLMCMAALRGAGDTRTPLWIGGIIDILAIVLNYMLIFGKWGAPTLGVDGSAIATLIAIAAGGVLFFWVLSFEGMVLNFHWRGLRPDLSLGRRILAVGNPAAIEQLIVQLGFVAYVAFIAHYGDAEVAAYFIGVRILSLSFLPGFGFASACATLVGQGLGAGDPSFSRRAGWVSIKMAIVLMTAMGVLFVVFAYPIARLFIADPKVIWYTVQFMYALAAAQPLMAIDWTVSGGLRGAGDARTPLYGSVAGFYLMRLFVTIAIVYVHGSVILIWWTLIADYVVRSIIKAWIFHGGRWTEIQV
ncbi:MAG: MATE family efflux transporter [Candidatus Binataceae bacterium]